MALQRGRAAHRGVAHRVDDVLQPLRRSQPVTNGNNSTEMRECPPSKKKKKKRGAHHREPAERRRGRSAGA